MSGVARAGSTASARKRPVADMMRRGDPRERACAKAAGQQDHAEQRQQDRGTDGRHGAFGHLAPENSGQAMRAPPAIPSAHKARPDVPRRARKPHAARKPSPGGADGLALAPRRGGAMASSAASRSMPSKAPLMIRRFWGRSSVTACENREIADDGLDPVIRDTLPHDDVRRPWSDPAAPRAARPRWPRARHR